MWTPRKALNVVRGWLSRRRIDAELDEELQAHVERQIEEYVAAGVPRADARRAALARFGSVRSVQEACGNARSIHLLEDFQRDVRYGLRSTRRNPGYAIVASLSLGLGIGANAAIFTVLDLLIVRSVQARDPHELVELERRTQYGGGGSFSYPIYERIRDRNEVFSGTLAMSKSPVAASGTDDRPAGRFVSGNFFDVLGVVPHIGRLLSPADDRADAPSGSTVVAISYGLWQRQFGGRPDAIGMSLTIGKVPFTIVGVMPESFGGLQTGRRFDFAIPLASEPRLRTRSYLKGMDYNWLAVVGRLNPRTPLAVAQANLDAVFAGVIEEYVVTLEDPGARTRTRTHRVTLASARAGLADLRRQFSRPALLLAGAVGLVLLIACANVVNLLLARAVSRRREISLRLAIGASRARLIRQLVAESLVLGVAGGALGLLIAFWATPLLTSLISESDTALALDVSPTLRLVGFTAAIALVAALAAGLAPALRATRGAHALSYQGDGRTGHGSRSSIVWTRAIIAAQVAVSVLLLVGAALLMTTLRNFATLQAGFDRDRVLVVTLNPGEAEYGTDRARAYYRQVLERVRSLPGVSAAGLSLMMPVAGGGVDLKLSVEGNRPEQSAMVYVNDAGDGYFATMGTRLLAGRDFSPRDTPGTAPVAIVNEAAQRRFFPGDNPIGRRVRLGDVGPDDRDAWLEVVGVVANAKYLSLREADHPTVYVALQRQEPPWLSLSVRTSGDPRSLAQPVRQAAQAVARDVPVGQPQPLSAQVNRSLVTERLMARILGALAALALVLASVGLYGLLAYAVTRRTPEIGVRLALGASKRVVLLSVLRESTAMVTAGALVGIAGALALTRLLAALLYGVTPADPLAIAGALATLYAVSFAAAAVPAWRASRVDPIVALRQE